MDATKKVLIVDDEEKIREMYIRMFVEAGFIVRWAADGQAAINVLIREKIDLVLLDIKMPEVDGKTMFEVIREYDPDMKIIVSSVYPIERQKQLIPNAKDYYDKSQGLNTLLEKVLSTV